MADRQQSYLSKSLSFILRHRGEGNDVRIDGNGFASLDEVVAAIGSHHGTRGSVDADMIAETVRNDEKGRFELAEGPGGTRIRALSGHSFPVEIAGEEFIPEGSLWFGTTMNAIDRIEEHGLAGTAKLKTRLLASQAEAEAIAAGRKGEPLLVEVDAQRLHMDGFRFSRLPNGEIVTGHFGREYCTLHPSQAAPARGR